MPMAEYNKEVALAWRYVEGFMEGYEKGLKKIREILRGEGWEVLSKEDQITMLEAAARNALKENIPLEVIRDITGLDVEAIKKLQRQ